MSRRRSCFSSQLRPLAGLQFHVCFQHAVGANVSLGSGCWKKKVDRRSERCTRREEAAAPTTTPTTPPIDRWQKAIFFSSLTVGALFVRCHGSCYCGILFACCRPCARRKKKPNLREKEKEASCERSRRERENAKFLLRLLLLPLPPLLLLLLLSLPRKLPSLFSRTRKPFLTPLTSLRPLRNAILTTGSFLSGEKTRRNTQEKKKSFEVGRSRARLSL